jgi:glycosyltransferase involved in cell wall biosynthesis
VSALSTSLVSCIVPVFNGARFIAEALDSILAQTHPTLDIIVVDDGSTDGSAEIGRRHAASIRVCVQANAGPAAARNLGVRESTGEFIAFLDADDRWPPWKLARQLARFAAQPHLGVCVGHASMFHDQVPESIASNVPEAGTVVAAYLTSSLLMRRSTFEQVGPLDAALLHADDTDWFLRARALGVSIELVDDVVLYRRLHDHNMSMRAVKGSHDEYLRVVRANLQRKRARQGP